MQQLTFKSCGKWRENIWKLLNRHALGVVVGQLALLLLLSPGGVEALINSFRPRLGILTLFTIIKHAWSIMLAWHTRFCSLSHFSCLSGTRFDSPFTDKRWQYFHSFYSLLTTFCFIAVPYHNHMLWSITFFPTVSNGLNYTLTKLAERALHDEKRIKISSFIPVRANGFMQ